MRFSSLLLAVLCTSITTAIAGVTPSTNELLDRRSAVDNSPNSGLEERHHKYRYRCTPENVQIRKEWRTLSKHQKRNYIDAILCLKKKPSSLYKEIKGSKYLYDDFQILHIQQTFIIHFNAQFLAWHRWFTWQYEQALKECGYKGYQPYWDWTLDAKDIEASPLFDGSPYSLSGNGLFIPNRPDKIATLNIPTRPRTVFDLPVGTGGGPVTTGPFANFTVPFGPVDLSLDVSLYNNPKNLDYKPHQLGRDLNPKLIAPALTKENVDILLRTPNISEFNSVLTNGFPPNLGLHAAGHFGVGNDQGDTFSSPGDPIFFLHHAQIDRIWTLWQKKNLKERQYAISGTGTLFNFPPSPEFRLNDTISLGKLSPGGPRPIREFMNTHGGPFCYDYA